MCSINYLLANGGGPLSVNLTFKSLHKTTTDRLSGIHLCSRFSVSWTWTLRRRV